jgi:hypothetical protein
MVLGFWEQGSEEEFGSDDGLSRKRKYWKIANE